MGVEYVRWDSSFLVLPCTKCANTVCWQYVLLFPLCGLQTERKEKTRERKERMRERESKKKEFIRLSFSLWFILLKCESIHNGPFFFHEYVSKLDRESKKARIREKTSIWFNPSKTTIHSHKCGLLNSFKL